ncbi:MAG: ECF transporter S component [Lachnospiraceae bacterium]|uniref:ECF transporter S component n=1 Tax=Candidatus Weimeria bifida TaxID=2599074 RepID=A0A6N7IY91_9FIRM|nr:ECF transporter S component [Candidatus Weimeria bifida]RRF96719.1 MAG: ECF transporter S component [Lachnospiraceae bacterium]
MQSNTTTKTVSSTKLKVLVLAALFAALTFVGTFYIKMPAGKGYIHPGDGFVLLSGIFLGPLWGGLAAGFGSMLSDLVGGYIIYVPATFVIKALVAAIAAGLTSLIEKLMKSKKNVVPVIVSGVAGEAFMIIGYFIFEAFENALAASGGFNSKTLAAGIAASATGIPANIVQGVAGVAIAAVLYPILRPILNRFNQNL